MEGHWAAAPEWRAGGRQQPGTKWRRVATGTLLSRVRPFGSPAYLHWFFFHSTFVNNQRLDEINTSYWIQTLLPGQSTQQRLDIVCPSLFTLLTMTPICHLKRSNLLGVYYCSIWQASFHELLVFACLGNNPIHTEQKLAKCNTFIIPFYIDI